jgi:glycogen synthase
MLGWEFPPFISGGLGTACYGLTKALSEQGVHVTFVLPRPVKSAHSEHVRLVSPDDPALAGAYSTSHVSLRPVNVCLNPYGNYAPGRTAISPRQGLEIHMLEEEVAEAGGGEPAAQKTMRDDYSGDIYSRVEQYSRLVSNIAKGESFDVIHAHDWMTYNAGIAVAKKSGKPLIVHVHSTEYDRCGEHGNSWIAELESHGMHSADRVITVSDYTRRICHERYWVPNEKLTVVHNGVEDPPQTLPRPFKTEDDDKIVLFLGRITMQKGPEYFIAAAKKVLEKMDNVKFFMAGDGDMYRRMIEYAAQLGIGHKVLFTGFLQGEWVDRIYRMADLYVMPSVSEPFGIAPLEAMIRGTPAIISRQSGVSELLQHALKVDFWDTHEFANKIIAVLRHEALHRTLQDNGTAEAKNTRWRTAAHKCSEVYHAVMKQAG